MTSFIPQHIYFIETGRFFDIVVGLRLALLVAYTMIIKDTAKYFYNNFLRNRLLYKPTDEDALKSVIMFLSICMVIWQTRAFMGLNVVNYMSLIGLLLSLSAVITFVLYNNRKYSKRAARVRSITFSSMFVICIIAGFIIHK